MPNPPKQDDPSHLEAASSGLRFRSPWLEQLDPAPPPCPLVRDVTTDVVIVGAGIAGLASAFFLLRDTDQKVMIVERGRAGHGASGRNAGQLVTYFERPLCDLVDVFGFDLATRGQAEIETAWSLLDQMIQQTGISVPVERVIGAMGMFTLNHLLIHLRNLQIRRQANLDDETIEISQDAPFLDQIPLEYRSLYSVVAQSKIRERLEIEQDAYHAVLLNRKGCGNSALICQELLKYLTREFPARFSYADHTTINNITLFPDTAQLAGGGHEIGASRVILCTNGFDLHKIEDRSGLTPALQRQNQIRSVIGFMAGYKNPRPAPPAANSYINNKEIGGKDPYFYMTRRPYTVGHETTTLTCFGGPETPATPENPYIPDGDTPPEMNNIFDNEVRAMISPHRPRGQAYDFNWHGLMAYTETKVRKVGFDPHNPVLMYNLGCNGVGFLPSIAGGLRIARLHSGEKLAPSIFDPT